ncbi:MAG TPA: M1 family metallopeptidase [Bacteroidia bacterium]|nr:M1 family metallopeptidase [Bacteroidia bacterium]HQW18524.1 M1 family metallopeptidase [Bacteroidia bacterium]HQW49952.1 M1 family metallopeptidase [Bacteroidia bacterium]HQX69260.1 M1 family metallopeptidase [Bacteroidia bacterium]HQZ78717.1 M1 family metallopeptidase [Bacteroidia bacterium]
MNFTKALFAAIISIALLSSCKTTQKTPVETHDLPAIEVKPPYEDYRASNTILNDLQHTKLKVRFDWNKKYLYGIAEVTAKPYFTSVNTLILNARGMDFNEVSLITDTGRKKLTYSYQNDSLTINLDRFYNRTETYTVYIDYISKPDELKNIGGSVAINSDKGLYFVNADGKNPNKPRQVWTQGETQSNSVWFPTIDSPNQNMTQEISITVDSSFVTLSNGLMTSSVKNADGTRTDTWKQSLPAAPYLTMMAVSNFKVVKDRWRNIEVNYYVDPEYEMYAKDIFGNVPEILDFYSRKLGVDYPWEKSSHVVVHDYVSGAMENTSAILYGEFLQRTKRELLDGTSESTIAHEIFHHWFGDYVTCESWSNIPLNESFATYGEYLWDEYKYGREEADKGGMDDLNQYLAEAKYKQVDLIRFHYNAREDMFDRHSYSKGGRVLHMLRKYVGDDAFFASLKKYLNDNKFSPVEAHNLRLAFEAVTGQDLNWFFNQWFFAKGHPIIDISYQWNDTLKKQTVIIEQKQNLQETPLYKLPLAIDIYENGKVRREQVTLTQQKEYLFFDCNSKPQLINVDAEKQLLCAKKDNHTSDEWRYQYQHAPLFLDRYEAIDALAKGYEGNSAEAKIIISALDDKNPSIRALALRNIGAAAKADSTVKNKLQQMVTKDAKAHVRESALSTLYKYFDDSSLDNIAINDSSYNVMTTALEHYITKNPKQLSSLKKYESDNNNNLLYTLSGLYAQYGSDENYDYMINALNVASGFGKMGIIQNLGTFLEHSSPAVTEKGVDALTDAAKNSSSKFMNMQTSNTLSKLKKFVTNKIKELETKPEYFDQLSRYKKIEEKLTSSITSLKK